ncbi:MAG: hypothetical protein EBR82_09670 [Caulobacteraceae bacterium]|nr:hypothetical protein [Caulobacteraceae bacterium]
MSRAKKLPAPRLQLRWEANPDYLSAKPGGRYRWLCHYELVIPLDKHDIRADVYRGERLLKRKALELVVAIKPPSCRGSDREPCTGTDGSRFYDDPFRDGAHAHWDSKHLGDPPIYVIAPDGMAFKRDRKESSNAS